VSLPRDLCLRTVQAVVEATGLTEVEGPQEHAGRRPHRLLSSPMSPEPVGEVRVFRGEGPVVKAVYTGIVVPQIGLDSHMLFAFTEASSALPHFTLDSVAASGYLAFHLDLLPRVDLGSHLGYLGHCFQPLTATYDRVQAMEGLSRASISPRQYALMSPWMCVSRATEQAFAAVGEAVDAYREHWQGLLAEGLPDHVLDEVSASGALADLAGRDRRNRAGVFSREIDPVWDQIARLLGDDQAEQVRLTLVDNSISEGVPA
jgi:hypothetical protein